MIEQQKILNVFRLIKLLSYSQGKSIKEINEALDISKATTYRYFDLLREIGYEISNENGSFSIKTYFKMHFEQNEKKLITSLLSYIKDKKKIHQNILSKIKAFDNVISPDVTNKLKQIRMIDFIISCVENKSALTLINYKSTAKEATQKDRHVIAYDFDENSLRLLAYDIEAKQFKNYKVDRMSDVTNYALTAMPNIDKNEIPALDHFGFSDVKKYPIELLLTTRAASLLKEDFPTSEGNITKSADKDFPYRYKDYVRAYEGIGRFVLGLCTEIKIVKDENFKTYIKNKLNDKTII